MLPVHRSADSGPDWQLSGAGRHLEEPRSAQLDQPVPAQPQPGRHPDPVRVHAHHGECGPFNIQYSSAYYFDPN